MERPTDALLQLCVAEAQVETKKVRDIQTNREAWHVSFDKCAAKMCRVVQWYAPTVECDADTPPSVPPAAATRR